jgi:hypothetical protein
LLRRFSTKTATTHSGRHLRCPVYGGIRKKKRRYQSETNKNQNYNFPSNLRNIITNNSYQQTYGKLFGGSTTELFIRNVWAMGEERKMVKKSKRGANKDMNEQEREKRLIQFVGTLYDLVVVLVYLIQPAIVVIVEVYY